MSAVTPAEQTQTTADENTQSTMRATHFNRQTWFCTENNTSDTMQVETDQTLGKTEEANIGNKVKEGLLQVNDPNESINRKAGVLVSSMAEKKVWDNLDQKDLFFFSKLKMMFSSTLNGTR